MSWPFPAERNLCAVQPVATDNDWTPDDGPEVRGSTGALLLLLTGRAAVLSHLAGDGVVFLTQRFASSAPR